METTRSTIAIFDLIAGRKLAEKPSGELGLEHFRLVEGAMPKPSDGEVLVRVRYISLDAANRAWMHATYRAAVEPNAVMAGGSIAEVIESKAPGFAPGDLVFSDTGWQDYAVLPGKQLAKVPPAEPMTQSERLRNRRPDWLFRPFYIARPQPGETVVVSAAARHWLSALGCPTQARSRKCRSVEYPHAP